MLPVKKEETQTAPGDGVRVNSPHILRTMAGNLSRLTIIRWIQDMKKRRIQNRIRSSQGAGRTPYVWATFFARPDCHGILAA